MRRHSTLQPTELADVLPPNLAVFCEAASFGTTLIAPAFVCGGFPPPPFIGGQVAVFDAGFDLPPAAGFVEEQGRLEYIDGCTSSLLLCPPRKGDPCINHLHIKAGVVQTAHHHPSDRMGMVVRGFGSAVYLMDGAAWRRVGLKPGDAWVIPAGERHRFETGESPMDVLVLHPDSDWGPDHDSHQMLDATIL